MDRHRRAIYIARQHHVRQQMQKALAGIELRTLGYALHPGIPKLHLLVRCRDRQLAHINQPARPHMDNVVVFSRRLLRVATHHRLLRNRSPCRRMLQVRSTRRQRPRRLQVHVDLAHHTRDARVVVILNVRRINVIDTRRRLAIKRHHHIMQRPLVVLMLDRFCRVQRKSRPPLQRLRVRKPVGLMRNMHARLLHQALPRFGGLVASIAEEAHNHNQQQNRRPCQQPPKSLYGRFHCT